MSTKQWEQSHTAQGLCISCSSPNDPGSLKCYKHRRYVTNYNHRKGTNKIWYLGSKLSPVRAQKLAAQAKLDPLLAQNWADVNEWVLSHAELWYEKYDQILFNSVALGDIS